MLAHKITVTVAKSHLSCPKLTVEVEKLKGVS